MPQKKVHKLAINLPKYLSARNHPSYQQQNSNNYDCGYSLERFIFNVINDTSKFMYCIACKSDKHARVGINVIVVYMIIDPCLNLRKFYQIFSLKSLLSVFHQFEHPFLFLYVNLVHDELWCSR